LRERRRYCFVKTALSVVAVVVVLANFMSGNCTCCRRARWRRDPIGRPRVFTRTKSTPLDIESTAEAAVRSIAERFDLACVGYDLWQAVDLTQRFTLAGLNMVPIAQSPQNQTPMASQLIDVLKQGRLRTYQSQELRDAAAKCPTQGTREYNPTQPHLLGPLCTRIPL
jgi:hypothetical protein